MYHINLFLCNDQSEDMFLILTKIQSISEELALRSISIACAVYFCFFVMERSLV